MKKYILPLLSLFFTACQAEHPPQSVINDFLKAYDKDASNPNTFEVLDSQYAQPIVSKRENGYSLPKGTKYFPARFKIRRHEPSGKIVDYDDDEYFCQDTFGKWVRSWPPSGSQRSTGTGWITTFDKSDGWPDFVVDWESVADCGGCLLRHEDDQVEQSDNALNNNRPGTVSDLLMVHPSELLEDLARRTWHRIQDGHRLHIRQGETAITDYLLLEIARAHFPSIKIIKTSLTKEASQGTDQEWWVGSPRRGWIRYAMQAKRLGFPDNLYDSLGHKVNSDLQVDILIDYAKANNAVPLYCLYNATDEPHPERYWHCNRPFEREQLGCTVAPALA